MSEQFHEEFKGIDKDSLDETQKVMTRVVLDDLQQKSSEMIDEMYKPENLRRMAANPDLDITPLGREDMFRQADEIERRTR